MRPAILCFLILVGLSACSTEHGELIDALPELPQISRAQVSGDPADQIDLEWDFANDELVDEYRIYLGTYLNLGQGAFDLDTLLASTPDRSYVLMDAVLGVVDEDLCAVGFCDTIYSYTYFRVSAVIDGEEGTPGWRAFPSR